MSERTKERTRERETAPGSSRERQTDLGVDLGGLGTTTSQSTTESESGSGRFFSARALLYSFVAVSVGMFLGGLVPVIPFTSILGIAIGGFAYGLFASRTRYLELALAGGLSAGVAGLLSFLPQAVFFQGFDGTMLFAIAAGIGLLLAVIGHYFGCDLRDGLTKDLP